MSRLVLLCSLLVTATVLVRADTYAAYPPPSSNTGGVAPAASVVPYPYAQAQKDSYAVDTQYVQQQPSSYESSYYAPEFALAAAKAEAVAVVVNAVSWAVSHVAATALGSLLALAVCKLTPLCSLLASKWNHGEAEADHYDSRAFVEPALRALRAAVAKYAPKNA